MNRKELRLRNVRRLVEEAGGITEFAERLGMSTSQASQIAGKNPTRGIGNDLAPRIEEAFGKPTGWMDQPESITALDTDKLAGKLFWTIKSQKSQEAADSNVEAAPALRQFKDVPVVGTVEGGPEGWLEELAYPVGYGDGCVTFPAKDVNAYALRVRGESMRPRIKSGEFIVVEPNSASQPGDDVVVICSDGRKMVKELRYIRDDEACFGSINNGFAPITLPLSEIDAIHYVAAIVPRGAFYKPNMEAS